MKTEKVHIKQFKALTDINADLSGHHVLLTGENGVGKSSFIQFVEIALGKQTNIPPGAEGKGEVIMSKDGKPYRFAVEFKDGRPIVTIYTPDGARDQRKGTLASIVGAIDFDVDEFAELSKTSAGRKKQVEIYKSFMPKGDIELLDKLTAKIKDTYDERTVLNRIIKEKEAFVNAHPLNNRVGFEKFEPVNLDSVYDEMKAAQAVNEKVSGFRAKVDGVKQDQIRIKAEIEALQKKISSLKDEYGQNEDKIANGEKWLSENPVQDLSSFEAKIKEATAKNDEYREAQTLAKEQEALAKMRSEAEDMTVLIETSRQTIADTIRQMDTPVEGLTFEEEQLLYNGIPVNPDSLSTSELIELGIRMKIAQNPESPIFIQRAESIGAKRWQEILTLADKLGLQVIAEQVQRGQEELRIELIAEQPEVAA